MIKTLLLASIILLIAFFLLAYLLPMMRIASAYSAKVACSAIFLAQRSLSSIRQDELHFLRFVSLRVDEEKKRVSASVLGMMRTSAIQTDWGGCTLEHPEYALQLPKAPTAPPAISKSIPWADAEQLRGWQLSKLQKAIDTAVEEDLKGITKNTRAVVVLHQGKMIAEKYGKGFNQYTRLAGWSLAKSVTNALIGILVQAGKVSLDQKLGFREWQDDERADITVENLLRMNSGLQFAEKYDRYSDATKMLFLRPDAALYAASCPLKHPVGQHWNYASGSSNLLCRFLREQFDDHAAYLKFPYEALFHKVGMHSAVMETDASGTYVGSSYLMACAQDWARFAQLFLQNGLWEGGQLFPEWWASFSASATPQAEALQYGAHFWKNATQPVKGSQKFMGTDLPPDLYYASGFEEQRVAIIPSKELVIVRLGVTWPPKRWNFGPLVCDILNSQTEAS